MKKKKRKIHKNNKLQLLQNQIKSYSHLLPCHNKGNIKGIIKQNTDSWFSLNETNYDINIEDFSLKNNIPKEEKIKCDKIKVYPSETQRNILKKWMDVYITMYNKTIELFKYNSFNKIKQDLNWKNVRDKHMLEFKTTLIKATKIDSHTLNGAIQDACTSFKSALTNLKNGNITHFRLRYLKYSKPNKVLKIEAQSFSKKSSTFFITKLGNNMNTQNNVDLTTIKKDCKLHYNTKTKEMVLLKPSQTNKYICKNNSKNKYISLDPGIRCFLTGYTKTQDIKIAENLTQTISKHLNKIDKIKRKDLSKKIKETVERRQYMRINNKVDDMHWKVIKYLINNNDRILIGNLSTKGIVNNKTGNLNSNTKRIGLLMSLYKFKERLKYKCSVNNTSYMEIDENYTSKTCSKCGYYKKNLGGSKIYKCDKCTLNVNRDINGSRNILLNHLKPGLIVAH